MPIMRQVIRVKGHISSAFAGLIKGDIQVEDYDHDDVVKVEIINPDKTQELVPEYENFPGYYSINTKQPGPTAVILVCVYRKGQKTAYARLKLIGVDYQNEPIFVALSTYNVCWYQGS